MSTRRSAEFLHGVEAGKAIERRRHAELVEWVRIYVKEPELLKRPEAAAMLAKLLTALEE
jgi:hypothetical protein